MCSHSIISSLVLAHSFNDCKLFPETISYTKITICEPLKNNLVTPLYASCPAVSHILTIHFLLLPSSIVFEINEPLIVGLTNSTNCSPILLLIIFVFPTPESPIRITFNSIK